MDKPTLVQRLRDESWRGASILTYPGMEVWHNACVEAADRIEELEAVIKRIANNKSPALKSSIEIAKDFLEKDNV